MSNAENIVIVEKPCPVASFRLKQKDGSFYCHSCSKNLVDFREFSPEEIKTRSDNNTCGVFYSHQVVSPEVGLGFRIKFLLLTLLSVFGLNVTPMSAQKKSKTTATPQPSQKQFERDREKEHPNDVTPYEPIKQVPIKKEKHKSRKRKKKYTTYGCPSF